MNSSFYVCFEMASPGAATAAALNVGGRALKHKNLLLVIKQTAFEEYSQVREEFLTCPFSMPKLDAIFAKVDALSKKQNRDAFCFVIHLSLTHTPLLWRDILRCYVLRFVLEILAEIAWSGPKGTPMEEIRKAV